MMELIESGDVVGKDERHKNENEQTYHVDENEINKPNKQMINKNEHDMAAATQDQQNKYIKMKNFILY